MSFDGSVPTGFQQTEIGPIPEDWDVVSLGAVSRVIRGSTPRPAGDPRYFNGSFVPWLTVGAITNSSASVIGIDRTDTFLTETGANHSTHFPSGCVVIANSGFSLGVAKILKIDACANDGVAALLNLSGVTAEFVTYSINRITERLRKEIGRGNDQPNLNTDIIRGIQISLPTLAEQKAIAEALSDVDGLIVELEALVTKKRDLKQAAAQTILTGPTRLPGFSGDWQAVKLGDIATFSKGKGLPKSALSERGDTFAVHYGELFTEYGPEIVQVNSRANASEGCALSEAGDVLMPTSDVTPTGLAKASCIRPSGVILGGDILVIKPEPIELFGVFLAEVVRSDFAQIMRLVTGTTVYHIYASDMKEFVFNKPSVEEQTAIAAVLSDMDAEIEALEAQLAKTRNLKTGMMQDLLTGRVRLTATGERRAA